MFFSGDFFFLKIVEKQKLREKKKTIFNVIE